LSPEDDDSITPSALLQLPPPPLLQHDAVAVRVTVVAVGQSGQCAVEQSGEHVI